MLTLVSLLPCVMHPSCTRLPLRASAPLAGRTRGSPRLGLLDGVTQTVDSIKAEYDAAVPDGYAQAFHILFLAEPDAEEKAAALKARIEAGELNFFDAAVQFSACPSRDLNGALGTFSSLSKTGQGTLRGDTLPYEDKDTAPFDRLVFSPDVPLDVIHTVDTQWGTHLVMITARGGQASKGSVIEQAAELVGQATRGTAPRIGSTDARRKKGGFGGEAGGGRVASRKKSGSRAKKRRR